MSQACSSNSKTSTFHLQSPGTALAQSLTRLFNGPLKNWHPANVPGMDVNDPAQLAKLRELQFKGLGTVVDLGLGAGLVGLGVGLLRHRKKVDQARKELDAVEASRGTLRAPFVKEAGVFDDAIVWLLTSPWKAMRGIYRDIGKVDLNMAGRLDTPLGPFSKGWAVPALALGVPAMAVAGDRLADRITDEERQRLVDARKNKLRRQFNTLLTTPESGVKMAAAGDACAALLDFLAPRAADMIEKGAGLEMDTTTMARGTLQAWWLLSGILAYTLASNFTKRRDPGLAEQNALEKFEAKQKATEPVTLRLTPGAGAGQTRVAGGNPFPVAFPIQKMAVAGDRPMMDWWDDWKYKGHVGKYPGMDWWPLNPYKIKDQTIKAFEDDPAAMKRLTTKAVGELATQFGTTPEELTTQLQQGMGTLKRVNAITGQVTDAVGAVKRIGGAAWNAIQTAFPKAIDWLRNKKKTLGAGVDSFIKRFAPPAVPGADPNAVVPGAPAR